MLEGVDGVGNHPAAKRQPRLGQPRERIVDLHLAHRGDPCDQLVAELAPDRRPDLCDLLDRLESVQPRHQRVPERGRDGNAMGGAHVFVMISYVLELARFEDGLGQFLDEQRHTIGLGKDLLEQVSG